MVWTDFNSLCGVFVVMYICYYLLLEVALGHVIMCVLYEGRLFDV